MTNFSTFLTKIRSTLVLERFYIKKRILGLTLEQITAKRSPISLNDLWDQTSFPNYANLSIRSNRPVRKPLAGSRFLTSLSPSPHSAQANNQSLFFTIFNFWTYLTSFVRWCFNAFKRSLGEGVLYLRGLAVLFTFDAMLTDDEPLWEPVEWSLIQSWIMFIFAFAWIGENLISSRFGSYTGRDKRVWVAWYKTFWLIEGWYILSLAAAALFVMIPFYHEISYTLPLIISWWNWYSRVFFFKFISSYSLILYLAYYLQLNLGSFHWRKSLLIVLAINLFLSYLLYTHFLMTFFAYFTDPNWYHRTRLIDYVQLSHEPNKWSWGAAKRDHFSYHNSKTVFWFKNDGPFAAAFLCFHILFFLCLFGLYLYWLTLFRRIYATREITYTYTTYCVSSLRQFFYYFLLLYLLILFSFVVQYWRLPIEYGWVATASPIADTFLNNLWDYPEFLMHIFF